MLQVAPQNIAQNHAEQYATNQPNIVPPTNYYQQRDESIPVHQNSPIPNYMPQTAPPPMQMAPNGRRRSYGMMPDVVPSKRPHMEEPSFVTYSQQPAPMQQLNGEMRQHRQQAYEQQPAPVIAAPATSAAPTVPPPTVTSVVIGEDVINIYRLYEEHNLLRRRVEINEERLHELRATNTYLLHQNEQLRRQSQCSCTSTIVNPVTLTTTSQQQSAQVDFLLDFRGFSFS
jgi:hypothetical protein